MYLKIANVISFQHKLSYDKLLLYFLKLKKKGGKNGATVICVNKDV